MNEWNKLIQGVLTGGVGIAEGLKEKNERDSIKELYMNGVKRLNELMTTSYTGQQGQKMSRGEVSNQLNSDPTQDPVQSQSFDTQKGLQSLYQTSGDLMQYGEKSAPYINMLEGLYKSKVPKEKKVNTYFDSKNNLMITYDELGNVLGTKQYAPEDKKEKRTAEEYNKMSYEDALKLNPDELENAFYYLPKETQDKLKENPYFQQLADKFFKEGDYAPKTGSSRRFGSPKTKKDGDLKDIKEVKWEDAGMDWFAGKETPQEKNNQQKDVWVDERRNYYKDYVQQLSGLFASGDGAGYDEYKKWFWGVLDYDLQNGVISQEEYDTYRQKYY